MKKLTGLALGLGMIAGNIYADAAFDKALDKKATLESKDHHIARLAVLGTWLLQSILENQIIMAMVNGEIQPRISQLVSGTTDSSMEYLKTAMEWEFTWAYAAIYEDLKTKLKPVSYSNPDKATTISQAQMNIDTLQANYERVKEKLKELGA